MRVLSFIPAFLLAAASFVVAAPSPTPADTSCVSSTGGNGNDAPVQPVISIIANATTYIQPLSAQLCTFLLVVSLSSVVHKMCSGPERRQLHPRCCL